MRATVPRGITLRTVAGVNLPIIAVNSERHQITARLRVLFPHLGVCEYLGAFTNNGSSFSEAFDFLEVSEAIKRVNQGCSKHIDEDVEASLV